MKLIAFFLTATFWAGSFVAIKPLVEFMPPLTAAALRVFAALIFISAVTLIKRRSLFIESKALPIVWLSGLFCQGIPFSLLFWGETKIPAGLAGILNGTTPIGVFALSLIFLNSSEKLTKRHFAGLLLGILGIIVIFYPKVTFGGTRDELLGTIAVTIMAFCYAVGSILLRKTWSKFTSLDNYSVLVQQLLASFLYLLPIALLFENFGVGFHAAQNPWALAGLLYLGWVSSGLAFLMYNYLVREWGAVRSSAIAYLIPPATLVLDFLINRHLPSAFEGAGVLCILAGVFLIQMKKK
jgi:drug/metabolite transporter (DMT)-like permease